MNTLQPAVVLFGRVLSFDNEKNKGLIEVSGETEEVFFSLDSLRVLVEGASGPEFGHELPETSFLPGEDAHVVVSLEEVYELEVKPDRRTLRRTVRVVAWNYLIEHQKARRRIGERTSARDNPLYEVWEFTLCCARPVENSPEMVVCDSASEIQRLYPRGQPNDPLVPEASALDITFRRRFCEKGRFGNWCPDPRPLPAGSRAEPLLPINDRGVLVTTAEDLNTLSAVWGGRNGSSRGKRVPNHGAPPRVDQENDGDDVELYRLVTMAGGKRAGTTTPRPGTRPSGGRF